MSLNMSLELGFIVEESRTQVAGVVAARCNLRLYRDAVRTEMVVQLGHCMKLLRTLTAHILLNLVMRLHVIVEIRDLSERSTAIHLDAKMIGKVLDKVSIGKDSNVYHTKGRSPV